MLHDHNNQIVDITKAAQPQEPVNRRLKREAENGWYKGEDNKPASRARNPSRAATAAAAATIAAGGAIAPTSGPESRRQLSAATPGGSGGEGESERGMDAGAIEALVKQLVGAELSGMRDRIGQLEAEVLSLRKQLAAAPSPPR